MSSINNLMDERKISSEFFDKLKWITTKEAAVFLGISENALRIMVCRRQINFYKFGRRLRFNVNDLASLFTPQGVKR